MVGVPNLKTERPCVDSDSVLSASDAAPITSAAILHRPHSLRRGRGEPYYRMKDAKPRGTSAGREGHAALSMHLKVIYRRGCKYTCGLPQEVG